MLQQTLAGIEAAQADLEIHAALKEGDAIIKDLHAQVSLADWEELYENHQDNLAMHDKEAEMFGEALKDEDLLADLDKLEAEEKAGQVADLDAGGTISAEQAQKYREEHGLNEGEEAKEEANTEPKRQLLAA